MVKNIIISIQLVFIAFLLWQLYDTKPKIDCASECTNIEKVELLKPYQNVNLNFELCPSTNKTWGYKILLEGSPLIIQLSRPGLPGNEGFKTQEQAKKVAEFVISKIREGEMPPTVTPEELKELGVLK